MEHPDIAIIGPGAIGCTFGAAAMQAGKSVVFGGRTGFDELDVEFADGRWVREPATVLTEVSRANPAPLVLLTTKAHQTEDASDWISAFTRHGSLVATLQNGVEHRARVEPLLAEGVRHLPAVIFCPARRTAPGQVKVSGPARLDVPTGREAYILRESLAGSAAQIRSVEDWTTRAWTKLMMNAATGAIGVLTRHDNTVFLDSAAADLARALMEETAEVGRAEGAKLASDLPSKVLAGIIQRAGAQMPSIVADRLEDRPTEWQARNEVVVRFGEKHGIDVPISRTLTTLIRLGEPTKE